jgi:hypothetical protein
MQLQAKAAPAAAAAIKAVGAASRRKDMSSLLWPHKGQRLWRGKGSICRQAKVCGTKETE